MSDVLIRNAKDHTEMLMREIMDLVNLDTMTVQMMRDLIDKIDRSGPSSTPERIQAQYGSPVEDLTAELKMLRIKAEIAKLNASAKKDVADAQSDD